MDLSFSDPEIPPDSLNWSKEKKKQRKKTKLNHIHESIIGPPLLPRLLLPRLLLLLIQYNPSQILISGFVVLLFFGHNFQSLTCPSNTSQSLPFFIPPFGILSTFHHSQQRDS